jgi:hypothetical protein
MGASFNTPPPAFCTTPCPPVHVLCSFTFFQFPSLTHVPVPVLLCLCSVGPDAGALSGDMVGGQVRWPHTTCGIAVPPGHAQSIVCYAQGWPGAQSCSIYAAGTALLNTGTAMYTLHSHLLQCPTTNLGLKPFRHCLNMAWILIP